MQMWFRLPRPGSEPVVRRECPCCGRVQGHIHQHERERRIVDWKIDTVRQVRVKCGSCGKTWTCRPEGVGAGLHRTQGVVVLGVMLYVLGLSYRSVAAVLRGLVGHGRTTTVYRDVVGAGEKARELHRGRQGKPVRILGIDGTWQKLKGGSAGVAFGVDAERQVLVGVELIEEEDAREVRRFVTALCQKYGVEFVVTDEHDSYERTMQVGHVLAEHRFCAAHWKKSKQVRIRNLREQAEERGYSRWVRDLDELCRLIRDGPEDAMERLQEIHQRYLEYAAPAAGGSWSLGYHLRMLTLHLLDTWNRVGVGSETTNNTAERLIGLLLKIRSKTMRGFVRPENILRFVHLAAYLWENRADCDLKAVC